MRRILPFLFVMSVGACNLRETRWEKEGVTDETAMNDLNYCRKAARDEAFGAYPYGYGSPFYGFHRWATFDDDRYVAESRLTQFCMRAKGYQLVTIAPQPASPPAKS